MNRRNNNIWWNLLVFGIFLIVVSIPLFSEGMFMDGLLYAAISKNLALGDGSFWNLHLSEYLYNSFHEHPPLAFGLQSIGFRVFGDSMYVERFYSLFTFIVTGYIMIRIWAKTTNDLVKNLSWMPLFIWIAIPLVSWGASNNMLENTMMIFTTLSVCLLIEGRKKVSTLYYFIAGLALFFAFLSKGFVGLFPLSFLFWLWVFDRRYSFWQMTRSSLIVLSGLMMPFVFLYLLYPEAISSMETYVQGQVVGSIKNIETVNSRFFIIKKMLLELLPAIILVSAIVVLYVKKNRGSLASRRKEISIWLFPILLTSISGVVPIMVSMKQSGFYILATFPLFAIALALFVLPFAQDFLIRLVAKHKTNTIVRYLSMSFILLGIVLSCSQYQKIGRDKKMLGDVHTILARTNKNTSLVVSPKLYSNWSLHGYFQRNGRVGLHKLNVKEEQYLIKEKTNDDFIVPPNYHQIDLALDRFELYEKK